MKTTLIRDIRKWSLGLAVAATMGASVAAEKAADLAIRFDRPAKKWSQEALPLGNGRMGCMIFGDPQKARIQFNVDSLWTGDENPSGEYKKMGAFQNFGDVTIDFKAPGKVQGYSRRLDLTRALHHVSYQAGGTSYQREAFCSNPDKVMVFRYTASRPGALSGVISLKDGHEAKPTATGNTIVCAGALNNGQQYESQIKAITTGGTVTAKGDTLAFNGCDALTVMIVADTDYVMDYSRKWRGPHPHERLGKTLAAAAGAPYEQLKSRHIADYQSLYNRVSLHLGDAPEDRRQLPIDRRIKTYKKNQGGDNGLENLLFHFGRYLMISCSRPGTLPANLQGVWNDRNRPAWCSDYHTNINVEMNYWMAEPANLSECHMPFLNLVEAMREPSIKATQASFGKHTRGWTTRTAHNPFGGHGWKWNIPGSAWYAQHFWSHYEFTLDKEFLQKTAYPILKEVCEFWEDHLKELPDGRLVAPDGWSPEHGPVEDGVAHDQQIIWDLFSNYIKAADVLQADRAFRDKVATMRDKLVGPKIGKWGQLMEWMVDRDNPKDRHRHTSHLFAVFPGYQISKEKTPKLAKAAEISLNARGESGDSRRSWTWAWRSALWARFKNAEKAHRMVRGLLIYNTLSNLFATHPPFQMDGNFGITAGICEMLLQSHAGEIDLLPALPKAWATGEVKGLKARGAVTVDMAWQGGKLTTATLTSAKARTVVVRYGEHSQSLGLTPGTPLTITPTMFTK